MSSAKRKEGASMDNHWGNSLRYILESIGVQISNKKPSDWFEKNMVMPLGSAFPGPFRYERTPYLREIVDTIGRDHPAHTIAIMKGAQIGMSAGVLRAMVAYIIAENPANTLFLTGHSDLSEEAMNKVDEVIDACGIRDYIRSNTQRRKNQKTGDTNKIKEFAGGSLIAGSATNHKLLRQRDIQYAIVDDADAAKKATKESGSTENMVKQRTAAYATKRKIIWVSTPEQKQSSLIEPLYLRGDQRRYHVKCPSCGEFHTWEWETRVKDTDQPAGITWQVDEKGKLIKDSVGYTCQECGHFYDDRDKDEMLSEGMWISTAEPSEEGFYSYHISALYAPPGMDSWANYVQQWLSAHPKDKEPIESKIHAFKNLVLGQTYEMQTSSFKATELQKNQRKYSPFTVPERLSIADGNGKILILTFACDLNGVEDDARLDWEITAWAESGSSYSVAHGSVGTFIPREGDNKAERDYWTYRGNATRSVWPEVEKIIGATYKSDHVKDGRTFKIMIGGVDVGYMEKYAMPFVQRNKRLFGLKGDIQAKYSKLGVNRQKFKKSANVNGLFLLESNIYKDELADRVTLKFDPKIQDSQPDGFMNFPRSEAGLYQYNNYFSHFEAEKRVPHTDATGEIVGFRWLKKDSIVQNHLFDCHLYNMAIKDIFVDDVCRDFKITKGTWADFVEILKSNSK